MKLAMVGLVLVVGSVAVGAQSRGVPVTILQSSDTSVAGREAVTAVAQFDPKSETRFHTHPGEMVAYILEGTVVLEQQGRPPVTVAAGQSFIVPARRPHNYKNDTDTPARMFVTYFVEKGKPLRASVER